MADQDAKLDNHFNAVAKTFPPFIQDALKKIGTPSSLQLLALRRYIRKARELESKWVWSDERIKAFEAKPQEPLGTQIRLVKEKFTELNPGFSLGVSPIRSLKSQVDKWRGNDTVHRAAENLKAKCLEELANPVYSDPPDLNATEKFRTFLGHCAVEPEPTSAAPGLSDHGQGHAVDFVVIESHRVIAGVSTKRIGIDWDAAGWAERLKAAVTESQSIFSGPLKHPREPWHYVLGPR